MWLDLAGWASRAPSAAAARRGAAPALAPIWEAEVAEVQASSERTGIEVTAALRPAAPAPAKPGVSANAMAALISGAWRARARGPKRRARPFTSRPTASGASPFSATPSSAAASASSCRPLRQGTAPDQIAATPATPFGVARGIRVVHPYIRVVYPSRGCWSHRRPCSVCG